jgi:antitoxin (DNA-binding transcriptional repressor) of toxin-antitoxin stability system
MKTLTVREASEDLGRWLQRAMGGEQIAIHEGRCAVLLQPLPESRMPVAPQKLSPREALRLMQEESCLTAAQAEQYRREVGEERQAAEDRRSA